MQKLINSQVINANGRQPINRLASLHVLLLVLVWLPASFLDAFKYFENNYPSAGHVKHFLPGERENEQPNETQFVSGNFGCLFAWTRKSKSEQTTDLFRRGVAL